MQPIAPHLWFDQNAQQAAEFYVSVFENSRVRGIHPYFDGFFPDDFEGVAMPEGTVLYVDFELCGQSFGAVNGGPLFRPNPSISFYVACETEEKLNALWAKLSEGGKALMALDSYPFSRRYGWLEDRFGVSWQLVLATDEEQLDPISPCLTFAENAAGRAEEAVTFYCSLFADSGIDRLFRYEPGEGGEAGQLKYAKFRLAGRSFTAMDSPTPKPYAFNEGISLMAYCKTQDEIDRLWAKLADGGMEEPCGWLRDKFGVAWQILPEDLAQLTDPTDRPRAIRVNHAILKMKKIDVQALWDAYNQKK